MLPYSSPESLASLTDPIVRWIIVFWKAGTSILYMYVIIKWLLALTMTHMSDSVPFICTLAIFVCRLSWIFLTHFEIRRNGINMVQNFLWPREYKNACRQVGFGKFTFQVLYKLIGKMQILEDAKKISGALLGNYACKVDATDKTAINVVDERAVERGGRS